MLETLLPQGRPNALYRTEPYVLAADIYTAPGHVGRGGWTWYTGAAGWYYRVATENLLGLLLKNGVLHVRPNLPSSWNGFEADYMAGGKTYRIKVENGNVSLTCDGAPVTDNKVVADPSGHENLNLI